MLGNDNASIRIALDTIGVAGRLKIALALSTVFPSIDPVCRDITEQQIAVRVPPGTLGELMTGRDHLRFSPLRYQSGLSSAVTAITATGLQQGGQYDQHPERFQGRSEEHTSELQSR